jgi:AcrR family transcriptional regulator
LVNRGSVVILARSTIYRHWPSRTDVVASAFGALITPLPEPPRSGDLCDRLSAVLRGLAEQMTRQAYASSVPTPTAAFLAAAAR